jgi:hypothetical protein
MRDLRGLLAGAVRGVRPRAEDPLEATLARVRSRRRRRRAGAVVVAGIVGAAGLGLAWTALHERPGGQPASAPSPNYVLIASSIAPGDRPGTYVVEYSSEWSSSEYPGVHECAVTVRSADGSMLGRQDFELDSLAPRTSESVTVAANDTPASAELSCDPRREDPVGRGSYSVSHVRVEGEGSGFVVVYDARWAPSPPAETDQCVVSATVPPDEVVASQPITLNLLQASDLRLEFTAAQLSRTLSPQEVRSLVIRFDCRPFGT